MPELIGNDIEIYDGATHVTGFNGENALCQAIHYTLLNTAVTEFVIWHRSMDIHWVGPRAGRP